ncbi:hypothetical protein scyTo_0024516, partial [Scyliorhinus torazame]|nr:hypothetical protein [Scyliorhinus torazame]
MSSASARLMVLRFQLWCIGLFLKQTFPGFVKGADDLTYYGDSSRIG